MAVLYVWFVFNGRSSATSGRQRRLAYIGDITLADLSSPIRAERSLPVIRLYVKNMQVRMHALHKSLRKFREKNRKLASLQVETAKLNEEIAKLKQKLNEKTCAKALEVELTACSLSAEEVQVVSGLDNVCPGN